MSCPIEQMFHGPRIARVLVTGTLGFHYGTLNALAWSERIQALFPHTLHILGHAPDPHFAKTLAEAVEQSLNIEITLFDHYHPPQSEILDLMVGYEYLLMPYHLSPATRDRIPTKFHEAASAGMTLIFPPIRPGSGGAGHRV